jgi:hypothetical protein
MEEFEDCSWLEEEITPDADSSPKIQLLLDELDIITLKTLGLSSTDVIEINPKTWSLSNAQGLESLIKFWLSSIKTTDISLIQTNLQTQLLSSSKNSSLHWKFLSMAVL